MMKTIINLTVLFIFLFNFSSTASHLKGGEINWECIGNGQYVFYLKFYRDCNGIPLSLTQELRSTVTGLPHIPLMLVADNDLTPFGCGSCNNPGGFPGVEEFIFRSNPITLNGTPPPSGWIFYWDNECCRNGVNNINGGAQMVLRSIMYPYPPLGNANPCFDSSPQFTLSPQSLICTGYPFRYNSLGLDQDFDSLSYGFDYPLGSNGSGLPFGPLTFAPPYSVTSPMPGNPTINTSTGEFNVFPPPGTPQGNFALVSRVDSYRCGIKIASVFREMQIALTGTGCSGACNATGSTQNNPPAISPAPFIDPNTGLYTSFADTVDAGDTVQFILSVSDFEFHLPTCTTPQNFWIDVKGAAFDSGSVAPFINCMRPPCAQLNFNTPSGPYQLGHQLNFTWITNCIHAVNSCNNQFTNYPFVIKAWDDACPAPGINYMTFTVSIRPCSVGMQEHPDKNQQIKIYPNPALDYFNIELEATIEKAQVTITDITGNVIYTTSATKTHQIKISTKDFAEGIYLVHIQSANFMETRKIIVTR